MEKYAFELLSVPNTIQDDYVSVAALNNHGDVVGRGIAKNYLGNSCRTILWRSGSPEVIQVDIDGTGVDINDEGEILCAGPPPDPPKTFAWVYRSGQLHPISPLPGSDYPYVDAMAINQNGLVTGSTSNPDSGLFIYDSRAGIPLRFLGYDSVGYAINNQNQVAAMAINRGKDGRSFGIYPLNHAFLIEDVNNAAPSTRDLGEVVTIEDMNDSGEVVGDRVADGAFVPTAYSCKTSGGTADFHDLGALPGYTGSDARAINNKGDVVGMCYSGGKNNLFESVAFLQSASGAMQDLNSLIPNDLPYLYSAFDINETGQILGYCKGGTYLLTPIPDLTYEYQRFLRQLYTLVGSGGLQVWYGPGTRPIPTGPEPFDPRAVFTQLSIEQQDILIGIGIGTLASLAQARSREEIERSVFGLISRALKKLPPG